MSGGLCRRRRQSPPLTKTSCELPQAVRSQEHETLPTFVMDMCDCNHTL